MQTLNDTLDSIMQLDPSSREILLEILQKRQIEERRNEIAQNFTEAVTDFKSGKIKKHNSTDTISILNSLLSNG